MKPAFSSRRGPSFSEGWGRGKGSVLMLIPIALVIFQGAVTTHSFVCHSVC